MINIPWEKLSCVYHRSNRHYTDLTNLCPCCVNFCKQNFKNWSGNDVVDKFIQDTQLSATNVDEIIEWIPYSSFRYIRYIAKGGFGKVYMANWINGKIISWDNIEQNWERLSNEIIALKSLHNSKNITTEFINEVLISLILLELLNYNFN
jgi:hypothetical protein